MRCRTLLVQRVLSECFGHLCMPRLIRHFKEENDEYFIPVGKIVLLVITKDLTNLPIKKP